MFLYWNFMTESSWFGQFATEPVNARPTDMFRQPAFREATRLLEVTLKLITENEYLSFGSGAVKLPSAEGVADTHPILYYTGESRGLSGASSALRGYVFMDTEGNVQWHFVRVGLPSQILTGTHINPSLYRCQSTTTPRNGGTF